MVYIFFFLKSQFFFIPYFYFILRSLLCNSLFPSSPFVLFFSYFSVWLATFLGFFTAIVTLTAVSGTQDVGNVAALVSLTLFMSYEVFFCEQSQCVCIFR